MPTLGLFGPLPCTPFLKTGALPALPHGPWHPDTVGGRGPPHLPQGGSSVQGTPFIVGRRGS